MLLNMEYHRNEILFSGERGTTSASLHTHSHPALNNSSVFKQLPTRPAMSAKKIQKYKTHHLTPTGVEWPLSDFYVLGVLQILSA